MITPNPPNHMYVQVEREITNGRRFLTQAREIGRQILGNDIQHATSLTRYGIDVATEINDELDEPSYQVTPVSDPLMEVCGPNDLVMVLAYRGAPAELASRYAIGRTMSRLSARRVTKYESVTDENDRVHRARVQSPGLEQEFDDISRAHSVDPKSLPVSCRINLVGQRGRDYIVGLFPEPAQKSSRVLYEQSHAVYRRLEKDPKNKLAFPTEMHQIAAPFARFSSSVGDAAYTRLLGALSDLGPIRLELGGVSVRGMAKS